MLGKPVLGKVVTTLLAAVWDVTRVTLPVPFIAPILGVVPWADHGLEPVA